jgi:hypothetical protein
MNETATPLFYLRALSMTDDSFETVTTASIKDAYRAAAANGLHPDHGGDAELWALVTAAYNELKAIFTKKRGKSINHTDEAWLRAFDKATAPKLAAAPKADKKAAGSKTTDGWVFEEKDGESKDDRRKRYARERQQYRYASDPDFAAARKAASKKSHSKKPTTAASA